MYQTVKNFQQETEQWYWSNIKARSRGREKVYVNIWRNRAMGLAQITVELYNTNCKRTKYLVFFFYKPQKIYIYEYFHSAAVDEIICCGSIYKNAFLRINDK